MNRVSFPAPAPDRTRHTLAPGIVLDARRAVWLAETRTLAVADLHLGYVWAHRKSGQMLPLSAQEETTEQLLALVAEYGAHELVLLGDIVHEAVRVAELREELCHLFSRVRAEVELVCVAGNHDRKLAQLLVDCGIDAPLVREHRRGPHCLAHGDTLLSGSVAGWTLIGHEHPAITLSDGVANAAKCPCFLVAPGLIILPAFSRWAAGSDVRRQQFMSPLAQAATFHKAVAILAGKLLPVPVRLVP